jgi:hypothetical protein
MGLFDGFSIGGAISSATSNFSSVSGAISSITGGLNSTLGKFNSQFGGVLAGTNIGSTINKAARVASIVDNLLGNSGRLNDVGRAFRSVGNAAQGVYVGANPQDRGFTPAIAREDAVSNRTDTSAAGDWRVSLSIPTEVAASPIFASMMGENRTGGRMVFPFNPTILLGHSAAYANITPTHTNYPYHAYQNSSIDNITITGEFFNENEADALYWVACVHFLRTMTKMFYGNGDKVGNPPLVSRLNGYGKYVLNDIPVLITNFTVDLPADVDYIPVVVPGDPAPNYVPTQSQITVTCVPNYARRAAARFDLKKFSEGGFIGKGREGFV